MKKLFFAALVSVTILAATAQTKVLIDGTNSPNIISKHIYGHFSEHLGRCIYDGFWVSDSMNVLKKDRIRMDIVEALKK